MSNQCKQKISKTWLFRRLNLVIVWTKMGLWISNKKWRCWVPRARGWVSKASPRRIISCRTQKGLCRDPEPFFLLIRWRLTLSTALWSTHLMCQKKEEFHTRKKKKKQGKGWSHSKPLRGRRKKREEGLEEQLVPLKFYHADHDRVTQWKNSEVL